MPKNFIVAFSLFILLSLIASTSFAGTKDDEIAIEAATSFLHLLDSGQVEEAFLATSKLHQNSGRKMWWIAENKNQRHYYGSLTNRTIKSTQTKSTLPHLPDGEYFVITYNSSFEHKKETLERVEVVKESENIWKVTEYYCH